MTLSASVTCNSSFVGIWEGSSQSMLRYTPEYEKQGTPIIGIEDLRALGQIIRPIKTRIESAECRCYGPGLPSGSVGSHEVIGQSGCQDTKRQV